MPDPRDHELAGIAQRRGEQLRVRGQNHIPLAGHHKSWRIDCREISRIDRGIVHHEAKTFDQRFKVGQLAGAKGRDGMGGISDRLRPRLQPLREEIRPNQDKG